MSEPLKYWLQTIGAIAGLLTLAIAIVAMLISVRQPASLEEKGARFVLRIPVLILATLLFVAAGIYFWRPLPFVPANWIGNTLLYIGALFYYNGLILYLWGLYSLGKMFAPSTGFGVRLQAAHKLVTSGPYSFVRHPMYLAVILVANGSCMLYQTWSTFAFALMMYGLVVRAHREEKILAREFGFEWKNYIARVPAWIPGFR